MTTGRMARPWHEPELPVQPRPVHTKALREDAINTEAQTRARLGFGDDQIGGGIPQAPTGQGGGAEPGSIGGAPVTLAAREPLIPGRGRDGGARAGGATEEGGNRRDTLGVLED